MSLTLYMDVHVRRAVTQGLRLRGVDVVTAQEDKSAHLSDAALLSRSTLLGRTIFTQDDDLLREACQRRRTSVPFAGVIYSHQLDITIGECVGDLELMAKGSSAEEWLNRVGYLPLK